MAIVKCPTCQSSNVYKYNYFKRNMRWCVCLDCGEWFIDRYEDKDIDRILYDELVED